MEAYYTQEGAMRDHNLVEGGKIEADVLGLRASCRTDMTSKTA